MDAGLLFKYTIAGLMPLMMVSSLGVLLAHKGIWDKHGINSVSKAYTNFFNPVFVFFNITEAIKLSEISEIWPVLISPFIFLLVGTFVSFSHSLFSRRIPNMSRVISALLIFSNIGNLPIILMKGICSPYGPLKGNKYCSKSNSYISLQLLTYNAIIWSYGWSLVSKDKSENPMLRHEEDFEVARDPIWRTVIRNLALPGPLACLAALVASLIPGLQSTLFEQDSALYCFSQTGLQLGISGVVLGQTSLGANLVLIKDQEMALSKRFLFGIIFFKNFYMPMCGLALVSLAWWVGIFGDNLVMGYIVFISFCAPSAFVVLLICQNLEYGVKEMTWMMLGVYGCTFPTLIIFSYIFFVIFRTS